MEIRFYLDPDSELPHISKHGVQEPEVVEVLESPLEDGSGVEGTRVAIGQTEAGRFLKVICRSQRPSLSSWSQLMNGARKL